MGQIKHVGVIALWIAGALVAIFVGGPLLSLAGKTVAAVIGGVGLIAWLVSLYVWRNNIFSGFCWMVMAAAGFAIWLHEN